MRQKIRQIVTFLENHDDNWPPKEADAFNVWVNNKIKSIPEEVRPTAKIIISSDWGYNGVHYATLEISYERLETDEEMSKREKLLKHQKDKDILTIRNLERTVRELKKRIEEEDNNVLS